MFDILVGDWGILTALVLMLLALMHAYRSTVQIIVFDRDTVYRFITRASFGAVAVFLLWVTVFDNWRQLVGAVTTYTHDKKTGAASDPFYSTPASDLERTISWVLFGLAVIGMAYIFARYARGYWGPLVTTPSALVMYYVLNAFRVRFDVDSVRIADESITGLADILATLVWIAGLWAAFALLIICMFLLFWGPVALVFAIIYRSTIGKVRYDEPEMYRIIRERSEARKQGAEHGPHTSV